jgi:hypothetical protein
MIINLFNETVVTQLTGSILPLSIKFFGASQRIQNFFRNFGASISVGSFSSIILMALSVCLENSVVCFVESCLMGSAKRAPDFHHSGCFPFPEDLH